MLATVIIITQYESLFSLILSDNDEYPKLTNPIFFLSDIFHQIPIRMEYTSEQLNYFRASYIAFNLIPEGLRTVFKQEWDFLYKATLFGEWKDTPQNGLDFYNTETPKSHTKNARLLTTIQRGSTAEWDCTCLFFAILFSDTIGNTLSPGIRKEVDDLRQVRNEIAHNNVAELIDAEFQKYVARVLAAFTSLKLPINEVDDIKNQTDFPTAELNALKVQADNLRADLQMKEQEAKNLTSELQTKKEEVETLTQEINSKVESFCTLTFKPSHPIIRRLNDVTRIMKKLDELQNESKEAISTVYLSGIPGCGKSQIARQLGEEFFDKKLRESKGLTFVATLNAETLDSVADSYSSLARHLGVTEYTLTNLETYSKGKPREKIQYLKRVIYPKTKQFSKWLMIVDNVIDLSLVRNDLPPTGSEEWGHGQVLITTQDSSSIPSNAPLTYHESLSKGMHPDDAMNLLRQVSQIQNQEQAEKVAEALEYQPLALAAAAFYVQTVRDNGSPNYSWTNYKETLCRGEREATEEFLANQNMAYSKTTTTAIKMAITRASESNEVLQQVFCLFSLCASEHLPLEVAVDFIKLRGTEKTEEWIKTKLFKSSLLSCLRDDDGPCTAFLRVHNIVHEVIKWVVTSRSDVKDRLHSISVVVNIFYSFLENNKNLLRSSRHVFSTLRRITNHCKALHEILNSVQLRNSEKMFNAITPGKLVSWLSLTAEVCLDLGNPSDGYVFGKSGCNFLHFLDDSQNDKSIMAHTYNILGKAYNNLDQCSQAKEYTEKALTIRIEIYGEHHGDVATSYNNLGNVYSRLGHYTEAKLHYEKALMLRKEIYGEHHGVVATTYNNLGHVYRNLSQYAEAKVYYKKALTMRKEIYGEHHGDVATSYNDLGNVHRNLGQYTQAEEYHEKALAMRKAIYGEHHCDVASSYNNLGVVYRNLGQYGQAKEYHEKALTIAKEVYGEHHGDVAAGFNNLGNVYRDLGQYSQAKTYYEKALTIRKEIYGEQHGLVAATVDNLGIVFRDLGQYSQAKEYHERALTIRIKIYGEHHGNVAASYNNLGIVCSYLGQFSQAKEYYEKDLAISKEIYGGELHGDVATSYNNLGTAYSDLSQYSEAKEYYEKALTIRKDVYGEHHANVATSYNNLGTVYSYLGQYCRAKENHERALTIRKEIYGEKHNLVANSYANLGCVYSDLTQYDAAIGSFQKALQIYKAVYGEQHADVERICRNIRIVEREQRERNKVEIK